MPVEHKVSERPGAGGLETLRYEAVFETNALSGATTLVFHDTNFASRVGWKEVVVRADRGAAIKSSSAPATSASNALRAYPKDLLQSPLDVSSARIVFEPDLSNQP